MDRQPLEYPDVKGCCPSAAKRVFQPADEEACTNDLQLHQVALPTTASLSHLDGLTLSNIAFKLTTLTIGLLMQTGDRVLRAKLASHVRRLNFSRAELPTYLTSLRRGTRVWLLPDVLMRPMPLLTTLTISRTRPIHLRCALTNLPPSITQLGLLGVCINVFRSKDMIFNLPALVGLQLSDVVVHIVARVTVSKYVTRIGHPYGLVSEDDWLIASLQNSPALVKVAFTYMLTPQTIVSSACHHAIASPPMLEELEVRRFPIDQACWPRHLHTLKLTSGTVDDLYSIPDTVTDLHMAHAVSNTTLMTWLSMAPSSLLHLRVNGWRIVFGDDLWLLIARFTGLQTLQISRGWSFDVNLPASLGDLTLLPRTIKVMSISFAAIASQWHQLPVGVSFAEIGRDVIIKRAQLPCYWERDHAAHVLHFPKKLHQLCLRDSFLPVGVDALRQLHISLSLAFHNQTESSQLLQNVPPTLVILSIDLNRTTSLFSFANVCSAERFPLLTTLCLRVREGSLTEAAIIEWINNVPESVRDLQLDISQARHELIKQIQLNNAVFPPKLNRLTIKTPAYTLELPVALPDKLHFIEIQCYDIASRESYGTAMAAWPASLRQITIKTTKEPAVSSTLCEAAKTELAGRISAFLGHKFTFRPITVSASIL